MYVPIIMNSPKIINKEVIYSDSILSLKYKERDIKITKLEEVSEYELVECLKAVFDRNRNVVFNTVQYSKKVRAIYFYTDRKVDLEFWGEGSIKPIDITETYDILVWVDRIIEADYNGVNNHYSVEDIRAVMQDMYDEVLYELEAAKDALKDAINKKIHQYSMFHVSLFNDENEVTVKFERDLKTYEVTFEKVNEDIRVKTTELSVDESLSILFKLSNEIKGFIEADERNKKLIRSTSSVRRWLAYGLKNVAVKLSHNSIEYYLYNKEKRILFRYDFFHHTYFCCENELSVEEYMNERMQQLFANTYISSSVIPTIILERLEKRMKKKKSWIKRLVDKFFH